MQTSQRPQCILDANVVIDLHVGDALQKLFELPYAFVTPDVIIAELKDPEGLTVETMGLISRSLTMEQLSEVIIYTAANPRLSSRDVQAFILARDEKAILLTGDSQLRKMAEIQQLRVHGTLWLLDEMIDHGVVSMQQAAACLHQILKANGRLPIIDVELRLKKWEQSK